MNKQDANLPAYLAEQLQACHLLHENTRLLLAVSGGADSMALLHVMAELAAPHKLHLHVAHVNHLIRPDAHLDADLVRSTCSDYGLAYTYAERNVPAMAKQSGRSLEMEAREQRYEVLADIYHQIDANALLTAHNRNDQSETILLNLSRGCSPAALAGISPDSTRAGMRIVRPLLGCSRANIIHYLESRNLSWREDPTNADLAFRRNALRHDILPAMRKHLNPDIESALLRCAAIAHTDETYLQSLARQHEQTVTPLETPNHLNLPAYRGLPKPLRTRILVHWLWRQHQVAAGSLDYDLIQKLDHFAFEADTGKRLPLPGGNSLQQAYHRLVLVNSPRYRTTTDAAPVSQYPVAIPGITTIPALGCSVEVAHTTGFIKMPVTLPGALPARCYIRLPQDSETLWVRTRKVGDRIQLTGADGHQKLQDIFTDAKVPAFERDRIPLLATDQDLIWIPGLRISRNWAVSTQDDPSLSIRILRLPISDL